MSISTLHAQIEDSMKHQAEWNTDNIDSSDKTDTRDRNEDELAQYFAEQMGQGITRQGGNY